MMRLIAQGARSLTEFGSVEPDALGRSYFWLGLYKKHTGGCLLLPLLHQFQSPPQRNVVIVGELSSGKPRLSAVSLWQHVLLSTL